MGIEVFDAATSPSAVAEGRAILSHGDVVAVAAPNAEPDATAMLGPWLVLDVKRVAGRRFAVLAAGAEPGTRASTGYEVRMTRPEAVVAAGLPGPIWFDGLTLEALRKMAALLRLHRTLLSWLESRNTGVHQTGAGSSNAFWRRMASPAR